MTLGFDTGLRTPQPLLTLHSRLIAESWMISEGQEVSARGKQTALVATAIQGLAHSEEAADELDQMLESDVARLTISLKRLGATCRSMLTVRKVKERRCSRTGYHSGGGIWGAR